MKIATASLNYYTQNNVDACRKAAAKVSSLKVDFVGFTEVRSDGMMEGLKMGLSDDYTLVEGRESPQAYNSKKWRLIGRHVALGTPGEAKITPNLYLVISTYAKIKSPRKKVRVISTHLVPLADDGHKRDDYQHRIKMWNEHWDLLIEKVGRAEDRHITTFVILDANNRFVSDNKIKEVSPNAKWIVRNGNDWIFVVEGSVKVKLMGFVRKFDDGSDHRGCWRNLFLH